MAERLTSRQDCGHAVAFLMQAQGLYRVAYGNIPFSRISEEACDSTTVELPRGIPNLNILPDDTTAVGTAVRLALIEAKHTNKSSTGIFVKKAASPHGDKKISKSDRARVEELMKETKKSGKEHHARGLEVACRLRTQPASSYVFEVKTKDIQHVHNEAAKFYSANEVRHLRYVCPFRFANACFLLHAGHLGRTANTRASGDETRACSGHELLAHTRSSLAWQARAAAWRTNEICSGRGNACDHAMPAHQSEVSYFSFFIFHLANACFLRAVTSSP